MSLGCGQRQECRDERRESNVYEVGTDDGTAILIINNNVSNNNYVKIPQDFRSLVCHQPPRKHSGVNQSGQKKHH